MKNESAQVKLVPEEEAWLRRHGGRDASDVFEDSEGFRYVFMQRVSGGFERVYLPKIGI